MASIKMPIDLPAQHPSQVCKQAMICLDCGSNQVIDWGACRQPIECDKTSSIEKSLINNLTESHLLRCKRCQLVSRYPAMNAQELESLYSSLPSSRWEYNEKKVTSWKLAAEWLQQNVNNLESNSILDVGAFDGAFLDSLGENWKKFAIEPSDALEENLGQKGIQRVGQFLQDVEADASYDIVTLFDVFEHLHSPSLELSKIFQLLKPGGFLILSTGNSDHWSVKMLRGEHWYFQSVQHICMANPGYLKQVAKQIGFQVVYLAKHSHLLGSSSQRSAQTLSTIHYWSLLQSGWKRKVSRVVQAIAKDDRLQHQANAPHSTDLSDHLFVVLQKR